jgi:hypothetical protein
MFQLFMFSRLSSVDLGLQIAVWSCFILSFWIKAAASGDALCSLILNRLSPPLSYQPYQPKTWGLTRSQELVKLEKHHDWIQYGEVGVTNGIWQGGVGHTKEAAYEGD